jgi:hypothetical protein
MSGDEQSLSSPSKRLKQKDVDDPTLEALKVVFQNTKFAWVRYALLAVSPSIFLPLFKQLYSLKEGKNYVLLF